MGIICWHDEQQQQLGIAAGIVDTTRPVQAVGASALDIEALLKDESNSFKRFLETSPPDADVRVIEVAPVKYVPQMEKLFLR